MDFMRPQGHIRQVASLHLPNTLIKGKAGTVLLNAIVT